MSNLSLAADSLPYHESSIATVFIQSSFLIALNSINSILDRFIYCGLLGQIAIGIAWGTPGANWLETATETAIMQLGYLGLILLVYEGGLSTCIPALKANLLLSLGVAVTGILIPIAFSFTLGPLLDATPLQCFAAGAALCSTSLGTTFTLLQASGLSESRLGVVLSSAAMLDDVAGLVMVQVISNLGKSSAAFSPSVVLRPVLVSVGFALVAPAICYLVVRPLTDWIVGGGGRRWRRQEKKGNTGKGKVGRFMERPESVLAVHTSLLLGCVAAAGYAGTSVLFSAYICGACISWWDMKYNQAMKISTPLGDTVSEAAVPQRERHAQRDVYRDEERESIMVPSGLGFFEKYYAGAVNRILKPLFFASIGFSIPISALFEGDVIWKGFVYSILMFIGKAPCGLWLIRISFPNLTLPSPIRAFHCLPKVIPKLPFGTMLCKTARASEKPTTTTTTTTATSTQDNNRDNTAQGRFVNENNKSPELATPPIHEHELQFHPTRTTAHRVAETQSTDGIIQEVADEEVVHDHDKDHDEDQNVTSSIRNQHTPHTSNAGPRPLSLYPAALVGGGMIARGEIGFLISSLAETEGIFSSSSINKRASTSASSDIFLVVTWAIVICTFVGPLTVGLLVRRVRRLQTDTNASARGDVLGVWGMY